MDYLREREEEFRDLSLVVRGMGSVEASLRACVAGTTGHSTSPLPYPLLWPN